MCQVLVLLRSAFVMLFLAGGCASGHDVATDGRRAVIGLDLSTTTDYFVSNLKMTLDRNGRTIPGAFVTYDPPASVADLARYGAARHGGRIAELVAMPRALMDPGGAWGTSFVFTGFWRGPSYLKG